ncbi:hypothetical protein BDQ12DRAFT_658603 [Crucibulum laeve]|uniref:Myb-like domain-containing protein n=1 Tax=Crucibulum laeve TaxID=68775 RepID=A0A5C3LKZ0_9AGAR|nr:hypothetical protein BDQ12DRAFT_658603 [Crucibulum laeve]
MAPTLDASLVKTQIPSSSTFSFKAPLPPSASSSSTPASPLKQRRVSLALPSNSPRLVQAWSFRDDTGIDAHAATSSSSSSPAELPEKRGKMRKISAVVDDDDHALILEKKPRKKWTTEETQMLVDGCNRHGVGNWKTILSDPTLHFDNRSPVDLKDRFRTYFPDAYKQHYPNARTHLSSKIRSTLPDGTPLFEKTRSKRRRPFTEEEDRALKAGYEKHGTVWAAIVRDPVFLEQGRRSTDLRDRFRNAFPELYQAAGYKPRAGAGGKKKVDTPGTSMSAPPVGIKGAGRVRRAATDDQLGVRSSGAGPMRSRRRAQTSQGLLRGGTKSVPQSTAPSEDEESEDEDSGDMDGLFKRPRTPVLVSDVSTRGGSPKKGFGTIRGSASNNDAFPFLADDDDEMELVSLDDPLTAFLTSGNNSNSSVPPPPPISASTSIDEMDLQHHEMHPWSSGIDTPTHSHHAWSTPGPGSPTSSHMSNGDYMMNHSGHSSPFAQRNAIGGHNSSNMIGKSAWDAQDWFSPNPRLGAAGADSSGNSTSSASSYIDDSHISPSHPSHPLSPSPFSFHLNHGVLDRYDLFPSLSSLGGNGHDFSSEVGVGETHSTFSDEMWQPSSGGFRGFTHHSNYAGDLIFGARTHQPISQQGYYGGSFGGFGLGGNGGAGSGLGLTGMGVSGVGGVGTGQGAIHPMQLHTPALPGIDEIELAGITLNDTLDDEAMDDAVLRKDESSQTSPQKYSSGIDDPTHDDPSKFSLDDLVHLELSHELHSTPPATPLLSHSHSLPQQSHGRPLGTRRSSAGQYFAHSNGMGGMHGRSISVPPSEARMSRPVNPNGDHPVFLSQEPQHEPAQEHTSPVPPPPSAFPPHLLMSSVSTSGTNTNLANLNFHLNASGNLAPGDMYDLPFLDLHYYGHPSTPGATAMGMNVDGAAEARQGLALDLASPSGYTASAAFHPQSHQSISTSTSTSNSTSVSTSNSMNSLSSVSSLASASSTSTSPSTNNALSGMGKIRFGNGGTIRARNHQRGQSAVCRPQDLMLMSDGSGNANSSSGDNKRKRVSWDGAPV